MSWVGPKKLAIIPVMTANGIPLDWNNQIMARIFFFPDPTTRVDLSLRTYIRAVSSGRADLDVAVMPVETVNALEVSADVLEAQLGPQLRSQGFDAAAIVALAGIYQVTNFWVELGVGLITDPGRWATYSMIALEQFLVNGSMASFDALILTPPPRGTHPSAYTKARFGWLDTSAIASHTALTASYDLHSIGLIQPPPSSRWAAVRIGSQVPYLMVEARRRVDQFESGISSEGVIVYRVQTEAPTAATLTLLTPTALTTGQAFTADSGVTVKVNSDLPGGFSITIFDPAGTHVIVPAVSEMSREFATIRVQAVGLVPKFTGQNLPLSWVFSQSPAAGQAVAPGSTVTMVLHSGPLPP